MTPTNHEYSDGEAATKGGEIYRTTTQDEDCRNKFDTLIATGKYNKFGGTYVVGRDDLYKYNGTRIVKENKVYQLEISKGVSNNYKEYFTGNDSVAVSYLTTVASKIQNLAYNTDNPSKKKIRIEYKGYDYTIVAREIPVDETIEYNFPVSSSRNECIDATYDMFCMPVDPAVFGLSAQSDPVVIQYTDGNAEDAWVDLSSISQNQLIIATLLSSKLGANSAGALNYDLQLLPYCPFKGLTAPIQNTYYNPSYGKYVIDTTLYTSTDFTFIYNTPTEGTPEIRGIVFYPKNANFSRFVEDCNVPNESIHYEWQEIVNPVLLAQGRKDGLTRWSIHEGFTYPVSDGTWELGPNDNNSNVDVEITGEITNADCAYIALYVSGAQSGGRKPFLSITSEDLPLEAENDYSTTYTLDGTIKVLAHWIVPDRPEDVKVKNECDFYRLASPNYNSAYEFKSTKLSSGINNINIDCTYKPFTPYIKLNPNYANSYYEVEDFDDALGLICNGDFSIPMLSDAWINYELQNRNYQAIFNRQIQNIDVNQQIAKEQQQWQNTLGIIGGTVAGGAFGMKAGANIGKLGGPVGAVAGAALGAIYGTAIGGGLATAGALKDQEWLEKQQTEARSFAIDNYNYQLGNVQALNPTITKSTPLTYNNKVWPILEHYSCKDKEKEVLRNKIKYDGMTIMAIDTLRAYTNPGAHLKGKMIRIEGLNDDSHIAQAIYEEVDKGFYEGE